MRVLKFLEFNFIFDKVLCYFDAQLFIQTLPFVLFGNLVIQITFIQFTWIRIFGQKTASILIKLNGLEHTKQLILPKNILATQNQIFFWDKKQLTWSTRSWTWNKILFINLNGIRFGTSSSCTSKLAACFKLSARSHFVLEKASL